jgi:cytoplasmic iron level regulating protein YaaA (DUF328/UPF0246 family)
MKIIISPAKKMRIEPDSIPHRDMPAFLPQTEILFDVLRHMTPQELKSLWKCSDSIAALNFERLQTMELRCGLTPAILAYEGLQYQHMAPGVFTNQEFSYIEEHLRILSGFYGLLRPLDGVIPYRLEMQAKLQTAYGADLYAFWGNRLARALSEQTGCILNLASKEYSICISKHLPDTVRFITCVFGTEKDGKIVEKGTLCKMARGEMVRYLAENQITDPEHVKLFQGMGFHFDAARSTRETFVFLHAPKTVPKA